MVKQKNIIDENKSQFEYVTVNIKDKIVVKEPLVPDHDWLCDVEKLIGEADYVGR